MPISTKSPPLLFISVFNIICETTFVQYNGITAKEIDRLSMGVGYASVVATSMRMLIDINNISTVNKFVFFGSYLHDNINISNNPNDYEIIPSFYDGVFECTMEEDEKDETFGNQITILDIDVKLVYVDGFLNLILIDIERKLVYIII